MAGSPPASAPLFIVLCHWSALLTGAQIGLPHLRTSLQSVFNPVVVISLFFLSPTIRSSDPFSAQPQGWSRTYETRAISVEILNPYGSYLGRIIHLSMRSYHAPE